MKKKNEKEIIYKDICKRGIVVGRQIGETSGIGKIYSVSCVGGNRGKELVMKVVEGNEGDVLREIEFQNIAANLGLTTPIYKVFIEGSISTRGLKNIKFITDKLDLTVQRFLLNELRKESPDLPMMTHYLDQSISVLEELYENGISHNDAHLDNFMVDKSGEVYLIDFGNALKETNQERLLNDYEHIVTSLYKIYVKIPQKNRHFIDDMIYTLSKGEIKDLHECISFFLDLSGEVTEEEKVVLSALFRHLGQINDFEDLFFTLSREKQTEKRMTRNRLSTIIASLREKSSRFFREKKFGIASYLATSLKVLD